MAQDEKQTGQQVSDSIISEFGTYQEFLDSQITRKDLYYLEVSIILILIAVARLIMLLPYWIRSFLKRSANLFVS